MRYQFIREHAREYPVALMCRVLDVASSGYYRWRRCPQSRRCREDKVLLLQIREAHRNSRGIYGSPRIHRELRHGGTSCSEKRVARLMREDGLRSKVCRKYRVTTDSNHSMPVADNLLGRKFGQEAPNKAWVADITYIWTQEGWMYLAAVLDLYSRMVVGWSMASRITRGIVMDAVRMAIARRKPQDGLMHHSDRGSQYSSQEFQELLTTYGVVCSMSRKGNCWDNAVMESFFGTLKKELIMHESYRIRDEARQSIFEYIEVFYNRQRRHSSLDYRTPVEYERLAMCA